jgi:hypothetical protein
VRPFAPTPGRTVPGDSGSVLPPHDRLVAGVVLGFVGPCVEDSRLHLPPREAATARMRPKRASSVQPRVRLLVLGAIVEELREHGRAGMKDHDAVLVRVVARTGLSRVEIQEAAGELVPLLRELAEQLRREGR